MKIIVCSQSFKNEFLRLQKYYNEYYWTVAWAGIESSTFEILKNNRQKMKRILIGLHFYQTHPDFINEFLLEESVRYIKNTEGTFHPKLYLFKNSNTEWEAIIGSHNFTKAAFTKNTEVSILISSKDNASNKVLFDIEKFINELWGTGNKFNKSDLDNYKNIWMKHKSKIKKLSGIYGSKAKKPIFETRVLSLTWSNFLEKVKNEKSHEYKNRIQVIKIARELFSKNKKFNDMKEDERRFLAGIPNKLDEKIEGAQFWPYFGSMTGAGRFKNKIISNEINISLALEQIPLSRQITKQHYLNFWKFYKQVFKESYIAPATRLLCMKRPDVFLCLDSKNKTNLCNDFGINKSKISIDYYWDEIIERILDSNWWQNPEPNPENEDEVTIYNARVAFLDSIFYKEDK
jgi:hypothetical protein